MKIALIPNGDKPKALLCAQAIATLLTQEGASILLPENMKGTVSAEGAEYFSDHQSLFSHCDCAVTVGGDGTIIHSARHAALSEKPVIGVNLGTLGYVAEVEPSEIKSLARLLSGDYITRERMLLDVSVEHSDGTKESYLAVNDAVISRGSLSCIIDLDVFVQEEKICNYRADGLLFSTPTGSTAYALSAGGPVIDPYLSLIELTPVCPHSLTARTVIFSEDTVFSVVCNSPDTSYLTVDGQVSVPLASSDIVQISKSRHTLRMNILKDKNFYKKAGEKL